MSTYIFCSDNLEKPATNINDHVYQLNFPYSFYGAGVVHHDDLLYLFNISFFPYFEETAREIPTVERQTAMWAHFAKTGEPIPKDDKLFTDIAWTKFALNNSAYLGIDNELTMKTDLYSERMNLWEKLFPLDPLP